MIDYEKLSGAKLWYLVGLITTDGNLKDGRHIVVTSKNLNYLKKLKLQMNINNAIGRKKRSNDGYRHDKWYYHIQICSKNFYDFLISIGLMERKSLILGSLRIPENNFHNFLRGVIDGDGSISRWINSKNGNEQWSLRIVSGSGCFSQWIKQKICALLKVQGKLHIVKSRKSILYVIKFGKMAAKKILKKCYYPSCFSLKIKFNSAQKCINSYQGWKRSKCIS